jgi:hypothetical protein
MPRRNPPQLNSASFRPTQKAPDRDQVGVPGVLIADAAIENSSVANTAVFPARARISGNWLGKEGRFSAARMIPISGAETALIGRWV